MWPIKILGKGYVGLCVITMTTLIVFELYCAYENRINV